MDTIRNFDLDYFNQELNKTQINIIPLGNLFHPIIFHWLF